jgi:hypothetical protein
MSDTKTAAAFKRAVKPSVQLLSKLGSLIVHADEAMSPDAHPFDVTQFREGLKDPEVQEWIKAMGPLLPVKRQ